MDVGDRDGEAGGEALDAAVGEEGEGVALGREALGGGLADGGAGGEAEGVVGGALAGFE